jgi:hypothetical protein
MTEGGSGFSLKIGIVACGAIVRELLAIARRLQWDYTLTAVPAQLHNRPEQIAPAVRAALDAWASQFDLILVGYADCGTRGALDEVVAEYEHVVRIAGPHCYEFYGGAAFDAQMATEPGSFFLTDFLTRHFEGLVWRGLGLDRHPELYSSYFANYCRVVYLRQTQDADEAAALLARAEAAASRLKLPLVVVDTGLECLEARLVELAAQRLAQLAQPRLDDLSSANPAASAPSPPGGYTG